MASRPATRIELESQNLLIQPQDACSSRPQLGNCSPSCRSTLAMAIGTPGLGDPDALGGRVENAALVGEADASGEPVGMGWLAEGATKSSAHATAPLLSPPAIRTWPPCNKVAV